MMRRATQTAPLTLCLVLAACGGDGEERCGPIPPCASSLGVTVTNPPAQAYRIEVSAPGDPTVRGQDCAASSPCNARFMGFAPDRVLISVVATSGTTTYDKSPTYAVIDTLGCGPVCRSGVVTVP